MKTATSAYVTTFVAMLASGCVNVSETLRGGEHENVFPFAEQTVAALSIQLLDFRDSEFAYLRQLYDPDAEELKRLRALLVRADRYRDRVVFYSVEVLRVAELRIEEDQQVREFAAALRSMRQDSQVDVGILGPEVDAIIADVAAQQDFLAALRAAQPLVDRVGERYELLIREIESEALPAVVQLMDDAIRNSFAPFLRYSDATGRRRDEIMTGIDLVRNYRWGDEGAMSRLRDSGIILRKDLPIPDAPSEREIAAIEDYLIANLRRETELTELMVPEIDAYLTAKEELEREEAEVLTGLSVARLQMVAWVRSHQAMANGVRNPGRLLELAMGAITGRHH